MKPAGAKRGVKYPMLLNIHGGPFTQYGNRLFDEFQVEAGAGYAVVYSNPRGSSGYGEEWGRAIRGPGAPPGQAPSTRAVRAAGADGPAPAGARSTTTTAWP